MDQTKADAPQKPTRCNLAVLTGNGVSIGFNTDLSLNQITEEVLSRFSANSFENDAIRTALIEISNLVIPDGPAAENDFEKLVGAFDSDFLKINSLRLLAKNYSSNPADLEMSLNALQEFAFEIKQRAIGHILEVIFERSRSTIDEGNHHHQFVREIVSRFKGQLVIGNLNYDSLMLSSLIKAAPRDLTDFADGQPSAQITWTAGSRKFVGQTLRKLESDFPSLRDRRIRLLHLHGSLTYWVTGDGLHYLKVRNEDLDYIDQWSSIRSGISRAQPVVVLTNQAAKAEKINSYPFALAYELFGKGLANSSHWLIAGYSFKDETANKLLQDTYKTSDVKPNILIITKGTEPFNKQIARVFGISNLRKSGITVFRDGVENMIYSEPWKTFSGQNPN